MYQNRGFGLKINHPATLVNSNKHRTATFRLHIEVVLQEIANTFLSKATIYNRSTQNNTYQVMQVHNYRQRYYVRFFKNLIPWWDANLIQMFLRCKR
jgi:hypothetical protein